MYSALFELIPLCQVHAQLEAAGAVCDMRRPDVLRLAPTPLYNTFEDVRTLAVLLREVHTRVCCVYLWNLGGVCFCFSIWNK